LAASTTEIPFKSPLAHLSVVNTARAFLARFGMRGSSIDEYLLDPFLPTLRLRLSRAALAALIWSGVWLSTHTLKAASLASLFWVAT
jgi:hypothetical protein